MGWAFVEASSNGSDVARFDAVSTHTAPVAGSGGFSGWDAPFDLATLAGHPLVTGGQLDLSDIQYVRLVDIPGTGYYLDSLNNPILDAHPATGSGGFNFRLSEGVAVINEAPEPTTMVLLGFGLLVATRRRGRSCSRSTR
ncbi:MAG: PEP-CTERM sorting domain-containing protein [Phycisphaerae bacterium]|nr:PEP-CTERM sorting domain-containing protein [Phycisphaerae bacterium]